MKKILVKRSLVIAVSLLASIMVLLTACNGTSQNSSAPQSTPQSTPTADASASGSITAVGSTALQPLVEKAAGDFMTKNANAKVQVQGGGSGTGLTQVQSGGADIGNSDIFAEEKLSADDAKTLSDHKVCVVGFAAVVNPKVKVDNLTQQQLIDIFTGKVTNWKDVGGDDQKVVVINRPTSSGTRATFKKYALKDNEEVQGLALTEDSSGTVKKTVTDTDGSIAYLAFSYLDNTIKTLKFEGVDPTTENVTTGKYPIWSYEHMYTKGEATGLKKAFIDYIMSSDVQSKLVKDLKFIPVSDMKVSR